MTDKANAVKAIAFDLDGTMVDSAPDIAHALNTALSRAGLQAFDLAVVRGWIGDGPDVLIARALAAGAPHKNESPALRAALRRDFDAATLAAPLEHGAVYPEIADTLQALHRTWPMVVVTNKPTALARAVVQAAGLLTLFKRVYGADRAELRKPLPAMLLQAAHDLGLKPQQMLMVGDSAADIHSATAAGATGAWVSWGYGHIQACNFGPCLQIQRPQQLTAMLQAEILRRQQGP